MLYMYLLYVRMYIYIYIKLYMYMMSTKIREGMWRMHRKHVHYVLCINISARTMYCV